MPNTDFEDARSALEQMFLGDVREEEVLDDVEENAAEARSEAESAAQATTEDAANVAEAAAQAAAQKDEAMRQMAEELAAEREKSARLEGTIAEISKQNERHVIEDALEPPTIDFSSLAFADEETQKAAMAKYSSELTEFNKKQLLKDIEPALNFAKQGIYEREKAELIESLSSIPEFEGIKEMVPQIERIIANNKWLSSDDMDLDEKFVNAYAIAKGVNGINSKAEQAKTPSVEELLALYNDNPEFQEAIEKQRADKLKPNQQVPPFSASSGAVNAALHIPEEPKDFEDASERTKRMFGA